MNASWLRRHAALRADTWRHGWSTAAGPAFAGDPGTRAQDAAVAELVAAVGLDRGAWVRQVHGGDVLRADGPGCRGEADALWTDRPGLGTVGRSGDCPLVLVMLDGPHPRWGFAHASWRATVRGVTANLLEAMVAGGGDPARGAAVICPSAGPCCYEVGDEVRSEALARLGPVAGNAFVPRGGRWLMDLWRLARGQLRAAGVPGDSIHVAGDCTICGLDYPSHRREGAVAGRFAAVVGRVSGTAP